MLTRICNRLYCDNECVKDSGFCYTCCAFHRYYPMKNNQLYEYVNEKDSNNSNVPFFETGNFYYDKKWLNSQVYTMKYNLKLPQIKEET